MQLQSLFVKILFSLPSCRFNLNNLDYLPNGYFHIICKYVAIYIVRIINSKKGIWIDHCNKK